MTDEETRQKRSKRRLMKDLHSPKYRQRIVPEKNKYNRNKNKQIKDEELDG